MCIWQHLWMLYVLELHEATLENEIFMSVRCQDIGSIWNGYHGKATAAMEATAQTM